MSRRILVVEDRPDNRQIIRDMLASTDYEITEAEYGEQALAAVAKARPDLILMDIQLPIMDGYEATRRIKANASLPQSRSSQSRLMHSAAKKRRRGQRAVMTMCRSLSVPASCSRKFDNTRLLTVFDLRDLVIGRGQHIADDLPIIRLVLHHQNALAHAAGSTCRSTITGSVKVNVEPWPGCDSTQIRPPCISMMPFDMASPNPVPPFLRVMALSAC